MQRLIAKAARFLSKARLVTRALNAIRYPGLGIADHVNLDIHGKFSYGSGCGIGVGSNIIIPEQARLTFGDGWPYSTSGFAARSNPRSISEPRKSRASRRWFGCATIAESFRRRALSSISRWNWD